jgi:hypothetical protein
MVAFKLLDLQTHSAYEQVPEIMVKKDAVGIRVQAGAMEDLFQKRVLLEPAPEHREIVDDMHRADVETIDPLPLGQISERLQDLALARRWASVEDQDGEEGTHGCLMRFYGQ